jgi:hypothetical protein
MLRMTFPPFIVFFSLIDYRSNWCNLKRGTDNFARVSAFTRMVPYGRVGAKPPEKLTRFDGLKKKLAAFRQKWCFRAFRSLDMMVINIVTY